MIKFALSHPMGEGRGEGPTSLTFRQSFFSPSRPNVAMPSSRRDAICRRVCAPARRGSACVSGGGFFQPGPARRPPAPQAGYLTWLDCREAGLGDDPAAVFLDRGRVALVSGPTFGPQGAGFARLNVGTTPELVEEAVRRLAAALTQP